MLRVWGRLSSINVQKVVWCLDELGLRYERLDAGGRFGIVDTPDYRRLNPNGLVPTLDDEGFVLWESNAIVRYLAAKHGQSGLWAADLQARADADRWMEWQATAATPALRDGFWQLVRTPVAERDGAAISKSIERSEAMAGILDRHLSDRPFVAGSDFSVGDIATGAHVHRWLNMPVQRQPRPNLQAWYARLSGRPGSRQIFSLPVT